MNNLLNATIEIVEMTDKAGQYGLIKKIKGKNIESGQTNTSTVYDKKKDGSTSTAWTQLQSIMVGETVTVGYAEQQGTMPDGKPFTSRIVRNIDKDMGAGMSNYLEHTKTAPQPEKPRTGQNIASQRESGEAFGKRLAINGFVNSMLASGKTPLEVEQHLEELLSLEDEIEKALNPIRSNIKVNSREVQI